MSRIWSPQPTAAAQGQVRKRFSRQALLGQFVRTGGSVRADSKRRSRRNAAQRWLDDLRQVHGGDVVHRAGELEVPQEGRRLPEGDDHGRAVLRAEPAQDRPRAPRLLPRARARAARASRMRGRSSRPVVQPMCSSLGEVWIGGTYKCDVPFGLEWKIALLIRPLTPESPSRFAGPRPRRPPSPPRARPRPRARARARPRSRAAAALRIFRRCAARARS